MEGLPKINQENKIEKPKIKEGVDFVFEQNPELAQIGTKEQYSEYLDTIFPNSEVKDIVYHGTAREFEKFELVGVNDNNHPLISQLGFFFAKTMKHADYYRHVSSVHVANNLFKYTEQIPDMTTHKKYYHGEGGKIISVLLNMNKIKKYTDVGDFIDDIEKNGKPILKDYDSIEMKDSNKDIELVVLDSKQIHILGNKQDLGGFKEFVEGNQDSQG